MAAGAPVTPLLLLLPLLPFPSLRTIHGVETEARTRLVYNGRQPT
jgi:hypothetical protein